MRILVPVLAAGLLGVSPLTGSEPASSSLPPDFSGRWELVAQETSAFRKRAHIGNHEEPIIVTQSLTSLSVAVQSSDPAGRFTYEIGTARAPNSGLPAENPAPRSVWTGGVLLTKGRRPFTTTDGAVAYDFEESRSLSAETGRMTVVTRINMFPQDLVRTAEYRRAR